MSTPLAEILPGDRGSAPAPEPSERPQDTPPVQDSTLQPEPNAPAEERPKDGQDSRVPIDALHAERAEKRLYKEHLAETRREIAALKEMMLQRQQEPQQRPDFFADPDAYLDHRHKTVVVPEIDHLRQQMAADRVRLNRSEAIAEHGREKLEAARKWFDESVESRTLNPADFHAVANSENPFAAAVELHERQTRLAPDYEEKVRADERAKTLAELGAGPQPRPAPSAQMPSNFAQARNVGARTGPTWAGPASLGDIFDRRRQKAS